MGGRLDPEVYRFIATLQARGVRFEVAGDRFRVVGVLTDSEKSQVKAWREAILEALGCVSLPIGEPCDTVTSDPAQNVTVSQPSPTGIYTRAPTGPGEASKPGPEALDRAVEKLTAELGSLEGYEPDLAKAVLDAAGRGWPWPFDGLEEAERAALLGWAEARPISCPMTGVRGVKLGSAELSGGKRNPGEPGGTGAYSPAGPGP